MTYTDEQLGILAQAHPHFETARRDYIRNAPRWLTEQVIGVYEAATGRTIASRDLGCAICVLRIYQTVGKTYFADIEERRITKEKEAKKNESQQTATKDGKPDGRSKTKNTGRAKSDKKRVAKK